MRRVHRLHRAAGSLIAIAAVIAWAIAPIGSVSAQPAPPPASPVSKPVGTWQLISSPNSGSSTTNNTLDGVAAVSSNDVWAVGYDWATNPYQMTETLAQHWNGTSWSIVPTQNPGTASDRFNGVAAIASNDGWAVGEDVYANVGVGRPLVEHWNGSSWDVVSAPNPSTSFATLTAVATVANNDVWAVGYYAPAAGGGYSNTLIEHWNGSAWSIVPSPNPNTNNYLTSMTVISPTDVWAVGWSFYNGSSSANTPLFLHWDGSSWNDTSASGAIASADGVWYGAASTSSSDVWAVGWVSESSPTSTVLSRAAHWDGTSWTLMPAFNSPNSPAKLYAATKISNFGIMGVGELYNSSLTSGAPLAYYESGNTLIALVGPTANTFGNALLSVAVIPGAQTVWAVGAYASGSTGAFQKTLIEYFGPTAPSAATATPGAVPPSRATSTPSATVPSTITSHSRRGGSGLRRCMPPGVR